MWIFSETISFETMSFTLCKQGNFYALLSAAELFPKSTSSKNYFRVSNSFDPDQAKHFVGPDLGPNSFQRLSANITSKLLIQLECTQNGQT